MNVLNSKIAKLKIALIAVIEQPQTSRHASFTQSLFPIGKSHTTWTLTPHAANTVHMTPSALEKILHILTEVKVQLLDNICLVSNV